MTIFFLTLKEVLEIHKDEIQHYGGAFGVRDKELLISALAQPCASFSGQEALNFKIKKEEIDRMASAFEHEDLQKTKY